MQVLVRAGRARIKLDMPSAADLEARVRRLLGPAMQVAEQAVDEVHEEMLQSWPIRTGKSRESFRKYLLMDPSRYRVEVGLRSELADVRYIRSTKLGRRRSQVRLRFPLQTDLRQPLAASKQAVLPLLTEALRRGLQEGFRG